MSTGTCLGPKEFKFKSFTSRYIQDVFTVELLNRDTNTNHKVAPTFLTVLSGSSTMSGILASIISENKFSIKLADLKIDEISNRYTTDKMTH